MKKGVYISVQGIEESEGVKRKIRDQLMVFSEVFNMTHYVIAKKRTTIFQKALWLLPYGSVDRNYNDVLHEISQLEGISFFYLRYAMWDLKSFQFLKSLKVLFPNAIIIEEIPAYPYKREVLGNWYNVFFLFKDSFYKRRAVSLIDRFVVYSDDESLWGVQTIPSMNGIVVESIALPLAEAEEIDEKEIKLLAVAHLQKYHGYERLFQSIANYIKKGGTRKIRFDIIGDINECPHYPTMVSELGIEEAVVFHGRKLRDELDEYYQNADIGVGSFGFYRMGYPKSSNLKIREYLSYGLPIISGCTEDVFDTLDNVWFYKQFPNDATIIDFEEIIQFYDEVYNTRLKQEVRNTIRRFALQKVDMKVVMQPIISYLECSVS